MSPLDQIFTENNLIPVLDRSLVIQKNNERPCRVADVIKRMEFFLVEISAFIRNEIIVVPIVVKIDVYDR